MVKIDENSVPLELEDDNFTLVVNWCVPIEWDIQLNQGVESMWRAMDFYPLQKNMGQILSSKFGQNLVGLAVGWLLHFVTKCSRYFCNYFITNCVKFFTTKCDNFVKKCDCYYKISHLFYYKMWPKLITKYIRFFCKVWQFY